MTSTNTAGGAGAVGIASTTALANGTIVGVVARIAGHAGAGDGFMGIELALNNTSLSNAVSASGAPSEQMITAIYATANNGDQITQNLYIPFNRRIQQGNILCINQSQAGTAFGSVTTGFDVMVME